MINGKVICEEAKAGRCKVCPHGREPHDPVTEVVTTDGSGERHIECTEASKCWHMGQVVRCVPVDQAGGTS